MKRVSTPRLALVTGLGLVVAGVPSAHARPTSQGIRRTRAVSFAPLFDAQKTFKARSAFELRFRAREALSGDPISPADISFLIRQGDSSPSTPVPAKQVKSGVFAVPFTPPAPGRYWLTAAIRGAPVESIPWVGLGVLGLAEDPGTPCEDDEAEGGAGP